MNIIRRFINHLRSLRTYREQPQCFKTTVDKNGIETTWFPEDEQAVGHYIVMHKGVDRPMETIVTKYETETTLVNDAVFAEPRLINTRYALVNFKSDECVEFNIENNKLCNYVDSKR